MSTLTTILSLPELPPVFVTARPYFHCLRPPPFPFVLQPEDGGRLVVRKLTPEGKIEGEKDAGASTTSTEQIRISQEGNQARLRITTNDYVPEIIKVVYYDNKSQIVATAIRIAGQCLDDPHAYTYSYDPSS